jgi:hypothetical protein|tara:strand:- start:340 stop:615 length:276 start_codon:yes stop_codon:yes gene_type:complete
MSVETINQGKWLTEINEASFQGISFNASLNDNGALIVDVLKDGSKRDFFCGHNETESQMLSIINSITSRSLTKKSTTEASRITKLIYNFYK